MADVLEHVRSTTDAVVPLQKASDRP